MSGIEIEYVDDDSGDISEPKDMIVALIRDHGRIRPRDLYKLVGLHPATTRRYTRALRDEGIIEKVRGQWSLTTYLGNAVDDTGRIERLTRLLQEIRQLKKEAQRILESLTKEVVQ